MADEVVVGWLPACWRHPGMPHNQMWQREWYWAQGLNPCKSDLDYRWLVDVEVPWGSVDSRIRSSDSPHRSPIWSLENEGWARGLPGWCPQWLWISGMMSTPIITHQECDLHFMQGTDLQSHMPMSKRFSLDRFDSEFLGMTPARQMYATQQIL